jgi:hypothetical protein
MPGTMSLADLKSDLTASCSDAADVFVNAGDMERLLAVAAQDFNRHRPRTLLGTLTAVVDQVAYPAPEDLYLFKSSLWGIAPSHRAKPWERHWPGPMPRVQLVNGAGGRELHMTPPPTQKQVSMLGSEVRFYYFGRHVVGATAEGTTLDIGDRSLLLLRAQAEAMNELVMRNIKKPVEMRDGLRSAPKNMTPSSWYKILMEQWEKQIERVAA